MPIILIEDRQELAISGTVFEYERLRMDDRQALQYLANTRGTFNQELYEKMLVTVALRGWRNLWGKNGEVAWPMLGESSELPVQSQGTQALAESSLFPSVSAARKAQLEQIFYVVDHLGLGVVATLAQRADELEPETLKKSSQQPLADDSGLRTVVLDMSSPVGTADADEPKTASGSPVTKEA